LDEESLEGKPQKVISVLIIKIWTWTPQLIFSHNPEVFIDFNIIQALVFLLCPILLCGFCDFGLDAQQKLFSFGF
jgi:hypothetical protein